jgi:hypothetical protein
MLDGENIKKWRIAVDAAVKVLDSEGWDIGNASTKYNFVNEGKEYPPKMIYLRATEYVSKHFPDLDIKNLNGGKQTNDFLKSLGFDVVERKKDPIQDLIEKYKKRLNAGLLSEELYKWQAIQQFQGRPDTKAIDFYAEITGIKFYNLIYKLAIGTINHLARERPEPYRQCFNILFDEGSSLTERIQRFTTSTLSIYRELVPEIKHSHHHDERTIATLLTYHNPSEYTFYKDSYYQKYCKLLGVKTSPKGSKYEHYLGLINEFIEDYITKDKELLSLIEKTLPKNVYQDENHKLLAQDILYSMLDANTEDVEQQPPNEIKLNEMKHPLNQIIFGPPGTGKTYNTINKALEIIDDDEVKKLDWSKREDVKKLFDNKLAEEQIVFTTFHQSMSYEEFIEGIKPLEPNTEDNPTEELTYRVMPGIFKRLVQKIEGENSVVSNQLYIPEAHFNDYLIKMSLGNASDPRDKGVYDFCIEHNQIALGFGFGIDFTGVKDRNDIIRLLEEGGYELEGKRDFTVDALERFIFWASTDKLVLVPNGLKKVKAIGVIKGEYQYNPNTAIRYHHFKRVEWLYKDIDLEVSAFYDKQWQPQTIYAIDKNVIRKDIFIHKGVASGQKNHVLIIDEINRGNVSQIFGELITLIEEDKREGKPEALKVTLPYSKEQFSVPPNLYIIGTMNTADRSVEALDTALRRRFSFTEMPPLYDLEGLQYEFADTSGAKILKTINQRIEKLLDRDHLIGHSYFLLKNGQDPQEKLLDSFYRNIIPLLQEYFFGDYAKIGAVLGQGFVRNRANTDEEKVFAEFEDFEAADYMDKPVYEIVDYRNSSTQHTIKKENKEIKMDFQKAVQELMGKLSIPKDEAQG